MAERTEIGRPPPSGATELAQGSLNVSHIVFMVMAAVAPAGGAVAILPLAIGLGVGVGTPGMFVFVMAIMLLFAVGFTKMVPYVHNAGAFFAYIVRGLGRPLGLAGAYIATTAYLALAAATAGAMGFFAAGSANKLLRHRPAVVGLHPCRPGRRLRSRLPQDHPCRQGARRRARPRADRRRWCSTSRSSRRTASAACRSSSFSPEQVFVPGVVGVGMIFAFSCYQGFEGTAIYAEEAKDPERTVPRATYISMGCIGVFFVLTSWAFLASSGEATAAAAKQPRHLRVRPQRRVRRVGVDDDPGDPHRHQHASPACWPSTTRPLATCSPWAATASCLARCRRCTPHQSPVVAGSTGYVVETPWCIGFAFAGP